MLRNTLMKRILAPVFLLLMAASAHAEPLKIGILPVVDTLPLHVAVQEGLFEAQGLEVELVPFMSALERDTAMQSGQLDGYFGDLLNTMLLIQSGVPMRMTTVSYATTPSQRMFALVLAPGLGVDDVEGSLGTGISKSSVIEYLLDALSAQEPLAGLHLEKVEVRQIPIRLQMLLAGELNAALLPEPLVSLAQGQGATVLATDEDLDIPLTVVCLHQDVLNQLAAFNAAYSEAVARINADPEAFRELMAENCRIPPDMAATFPVYAFPEPGLPSQEDVAEVQAWMLAHDLLSAPLPYDGLVAH